MYSVNDSGRLKTFWIAAKTIACPVMILYGAAIDGTIKNDKQNQQQNLWIAAYSTPR